MGTVNRKKFCAGISSSKFPPRRLASNYGFWESKIKIGSSRRCARKNYKNGLAQTVCECSQTVNHYSSYYVLVGNV